MIDAAFWLVCGAILFLLIISAFFSGSETALTAASRGQLKSKAEKGDRGADRALELTEDSERLIGSILLGNNLVNILATSLATAMLTRTFGESGVALATLVMTLLVLIFAEVLPKTYAISTPETAAAWVARPIGAFVTVLSPVVEVIRAIVRGVLSLFGVKIDPDSRIMSMKDEIAGALHLGHSEGVVHKEDRDRILGALDLSERTVEEIMLHRSQIKMIDADLPPQEILELCLNSAHTRLPIYRGEQENIIGVLHAKDLLRAVYARFAARTEDNDPFEGFDVLNVAMEPYFVPETTALDEQMRQFLRRSAHFALVVDEYGALEGLITLEDILEEIVGEITDEFDIDEDHPLRRTDNGDVIVDGAMTIRDLNRATDWTLPDEEAITIAGLVIHEAQSIPVKGQVFSFHGFRFEILDRKDNRITRMKIRAL